jgi:hypothetical protein
VSGFEFLLIGFTVIGCMYYLNRVSKTSALAKEKSQQEVYDTSPHPPNLRPSQAPPPIRKASKVYRQRRSNGSWYEFDEYFTDELLFDLFFDVVMHAEPPLFLQYNPDMFEDEGPVVEYPSRDFSEDDMEALARFEESKNGASEPTANESEFIDYPNPNMFGSSEDNIREVSSPSYESDHDSSSGYSDSDSSSSSDSSSCDSSSSCD